MKYSYFFYTRGLLSEGVYYAGVYCSGYYYPVVYESGLLWGGVIILLPLAGKTHMFKSITGVCGRYRMWLHILLLTCRIIFRVKMDKKYYIEAGPV